jgi:bacillithiol biosynthesis cysteine-adding enzyme BshC
LSQPAESDCFTNPYKFRIESLPFSEISGQSSLFLNYQTDPQSLRDFIPGALKGHASLTDRIGSIIAGYEIDRDRLADSLLRQNIDLGSGQKSIENISKLRQQDCVAIVTGQQVGLFSGPLYTIYKALSAIKLAECLTKRGFNVVPVFWMATEDHDFKEISRTSVTGRDGRLKEFSVSSPESESHFSVGRMTIGDDVSEAIESLFLELPATEFSKGIEEALRSTWKPGENFGRAFARFLNWVLGDRGLVFICPLEAEIKKLSAPIYRRAIENASALTSRAIDRSHRLVQSGSHAQVHISEDYFPLFIEEESGARTALRRKDDGTLVTREGMSTLDERELLQIADDHPERLSPGVLLRPVVQDFLFPTLAYFAGAAEIAYFAQGSGAYEILGRVAPTVYHRQSFSLIEPRHAKTFDQFNISLKSLFEGKDVLAPRIVESILNSDVAGTFDSVESEVLRQLEILESKLSEVDPTLTENLEVRRRKIEYHIGTLRRKFHQAQLRKDDAMRRRLDELFDAVLPDHHLQERTLNVCSLLNRYGSSICDWIFEAIDLDDPDHRILYL